MLRITKEIKDQMLSAFPSIELSYEKVLHKKVPADLYMLVPKGYKVFVGKFGTKEIDFIAEKGNAKLYIQVCYLLAEQSTVDREFGVLKEIRDQYPKYVISMDPIWQDNIDGIKHYHIADFLRKAAF